MSPVARIVASAFLLFGATASAQERIVGVPPDTARAAADTVTSGGSASGVDSVVTYSAADTIVYEIEKRTMALYGKGDVKYKELGLTADRIDIDWGTTTLLAYGVADTSDTAGVRKVGQPILTDTGERYDGSTVTYNFKSKKGKIVLGETEIDGGLYYGQSIKRVESDVMFIASGRFTSCDLEDPHYYFGSPEMKVLVGDKVIARPIYFYVADVPVFALPFGIFPSERGRRSGLIMPAYGESSRGRYLTHLGYYWAMNDYMDWKVTTDLYSKGSYTLTSDFRYAVRYLLSGSLSGSYGRIFTGEPGDPNYGDDEVFNVRLGHLQDFDPTTRLVADLSFMSATYYQQTSYNLNNLLQQNIVSNATLTKSWEGTPNSMTLNVRRDQNLQTQVGGVELSEQLPSLSFSRIQTYPFRASKRTAGGLRWYELIGYSYGGQFVHNRTKTKLATGYDRDSRWGMQHTIPINAAPKVGYITVSPFFNYTEKWYGQRIERGIVPGDTTVSTRDMYGFTTLRYFDMGISASTKLYGIFQPGIFGITGIRHQVLPSVSFTYQPDFSDPGYGYYQTYVDELGRVQRYSIFEREAFGGAPAGRRQALSFSLGNVFEMKTASSDSVVKENKFQLLNLNLGIGYNFAADSLNWSELGADFRTSIGQLLSIGGSGRFNLYAFEPDAQNPRIGRRVNKLLLSERGQLAEMTSFSLSIGTRLSGDKQKTSAGPVRRPEDSLAMGRRQSGVYGLYSEEDPDFSIPWNLDLMWNFSQNQSDPRNVFRNSSLIVGLGFNLTQNWKFTANGSYDLLRRQFSAPQISVYRDLHCWEMNFHWVPIGQYRNFRIEIRLKAPQLQDIKVTKQASARGIY